MRVIEYDKKYREDFIRFNTEWIMEFFGFLEAEDVETFAHIEEALAGGAMIFFAVEDGAALATCMTRPLDGRTWELCKLGSDKGRPHKGCGTAVFEAAMRWAADHGAERLFIITNRRLKPAIHIYEKHGFREIQLEDYEYARGDIAFECLLSAPHSPAGSI